MSASDSKSGPGDALSQRVAAALDTVRPAIVADGGDVWLVRTEDSVAYVQLAGACGGCAMVHTTLKQTIEATVRSLVPEITRVEHV